MDEKNNETDDRIPTGPEFTTFSPRATAIVILCVAVVAVLIIVANSRGNDSKTYVPPTPVVIPQQATPIPIPPPIPTYKLGDTVAAGKLDVVVADYKTVSEYKTKYDSMKTDNQFVIVTFKITNNDDKARDISRNLFTLVDADGKTYKAYDKTSVDDTLLMYETVNPGIGRSKSVIFETPKDVKVAKLRVDSGVALAGGKPVDIDLN